MKKIVIVGGMGPQASLELHKRILDVAKDAGACRNEDFPEILHLSIPVSDFISSGDGSAGLRRIKQSLGPVTLQKSDRIALVCNTAHLLLPELEVAVGVKFVSMIDTVADAVHSSRLKEVGLIASPMTTRVKLYEKALAEYDVTCLLPSDKDQNRIEDAIRSVIAGEISVGDIAELQGIADRLTQSGAQGIVLGCTELPLVFSKIKTAGPIFDCLDLMSAQLIGEHGQRGDNR